MRISVRKADPGYKVDAHLYKAYHNDAELKDCHTVDEERGYAVGCLRNGQGKLEVLHPRLHILREYIVLGSVVVRREKV